MQKEKGISTLVGIIIIIILAILIVGGVFIWQYFATSKESKILTPTPKTEMNTSDNCKLVCSWSLCVDGSQQQYVNDPNDCLPMYENPSLNEQKQIDACPELIKRCSPSIPATISITSPKNGEIWRISQRESLKYSVPSSYEEFGLVNFYVDGFLVNQTGEEFILTKGSYISDFIDFTVGGYDTNLIPGKYKVELKISKGGYPYSAWGITDNYITIVEGP